MSGLTLDIGALIAIERGVRRAALLVESARIRGKRVTVPSPVVVEWWRGQRGTAPRRVPLGTTRRSSRPPASAPIKAAWKPSSAPDDP